MKKLLFTLIGLNLIQYSVAQQNFQPGLIVTLHGDTLHGSIDYRNWARNPRHISFKDNSGRTVTYDPTNVASCKVMNEIYVSSIVDKEMTPAFKGPLREVADFSFAKDTVFLREISAGDKKLYYLRSKEDLELFYIPSPSNAYELLAYKKYLKSDRNGTTSEVENRRYLGQLSIYLQACPSIQAKLKTTRYTLKSLTDLFESYEQCVNPSARKIKKKVEKQGIRLEYGVLAAVTQTHLEFRGDAHYRKLTQAHWTTSNTLTAGIWLNVVLPRLQGKWSVMNELVWNSYHVTGKYFAQETPLYSESATTEIAVTYAKVNTLLRFTYPVRNAFVYANAGLSNSHALTVSPNRQKETDVFGSQVTELERTAVPDVARYEFGFVGGLGMRFKKYAVEARYEATSGFSGDVFLSSPVRRISAMLIYRL